MSGPSWVPWTLATVMIAISLYCAARPVISRLWGRTVEHDVELVQVVMGVAMAGMLVRDLHVVPGVLYEAGFAVAAAWFGWRLVRHGARSESRHVPHLMSSAAMLYMVAAIPAVRSTGSAGMMTGSMTTAARFPVLALLLAIYMVGDVVWTLDRLPVTATGPSTVGRPRAEPTAPMLAPRLAEGCRIAMSVTMGYMLIMIL